MSLKTKLNRLKGHINLNKTENDQSASFQKDIDKKEIPYEDKWVSFGAKPFYFDGNYCFVRQIEYPITVKHGLYMFNDYHKVVQKWKESCITHPLSTNHHKPEDLFFFDTETTGLGGGVGNTIFLLGHARVLPDKVVVKQHFLPNPGSEVALYQSFLQDVDYTTLVTYNGKAFDWPQVKTRHTLIRDAVPKLPQFGHFDLYHAARRLWKDTLEQVRLSSVEKNILQIERESDTPGYLAPIPYFDYLKHQDPEGIFGIIRHNEIDILSLITLYIHLSNVILNSEAFSNREQFEVGRWLEGLGQREEAFQVYEQVTNSNSNEVFKAKMKMANIYKKEKQWENAIALWEEIFYSNEINLKIEAGIELAKAFEHHKSDVEKALYYSYEAYNQWRKSIFKNNKMKQEDFLKRINRLTNRSRNNS